MLGYILRRLLLVVPTLFGIMVVNFALTQFVPGGPFDQIEARLVRAEQPLPAGLSVIEIVNDAAPETGVARLLQALRA